MSDNPEKKAWTKTSANRSQPQIYNPKKSRGQNSKKEVFKMDIPSMPELPPLPPLPATPVPEPHRSSTNPLLAKNSNLSESLDINNSNPKILSATLSLPNLQRNDPEKVEVVPTSYSPPPSVKLTTISETSDINQEINVPDSSSLLAAFRNYDLHDKHKNEEEVPDPDTHSPRASYKLSTIYDLTTDLNIPEKQQNHNHEQPQRKPEPQQQRPSYQPYHPELSQHKEPAGLNSSGILLNSSSNLSSMLSQSGLNYSGDLITEEPLYKSEISLAHSLPPQITEDKTELSKTLTVDPSMTNKKVLKTYTVPVKQAGHDEPSTHADLSSSQPIDEEEYMPKLEMLADMTVECYNAPDSQKVTFIFKFRRVMSTIPKAARMIKFKKHDAKQTLLYFACRTGCIHVVMELLKLDIPTTGFQYERGTTKSTVLHGANWGGHIEIVAVLLRNAPPEKNEVITGGEKKGWAPSNEMNSKLPEDKKKTLKELWKAYKEQGPEGIKKYVPQSILQDTFTTQYTTDLTVQIEVTPDEISTLSKKNILELQVYLMDIWEVLNSKKSRIKQTTIKENSTKIHNITGQLLNLSEIKAIDSNFKALLKEICELSKQYLTECLTAILKKIESNNSIIDPKLMTLKIKFQNTCSACYNIVPDELASIDTLCNIIKKADLAKIDTDTEFIHYWTKLPKEQINGESIAGQTLLYVACRYGCVNIVKQILSVKGVRINGPQDYTHASTPLHGANWACSLPIVAMLLASGAKLEKNSMSNNDGLLPYEEVNHNKSESEIADMKALWQAFLKDPGEKSLLRYFPENWKPNRDLCDPNVPVNNEGITFDGLINLITSPEIVEPTTIYDEFLLAYRTVKGPLDVLSAIIKRCWGTSHRIIHNRAISIITLWITKYRYDIEPDNKLFKAQLTTWQQNTQRYYALLLEDKESDGDQDAAGSIIILKETIDLVKNNQPLPIIDVPSSLPINSSEEQLTLQKDPTWRQSQANLHREINKVSALLNEVPSKPSAPESTVPPKSNSKLKNEPSLMDIDPAEIARQLSLLEEYNFRKLQISEFLMNKIDGKTTPSIYSYNLWIRNLTTWIKLEILCTLKVKKRVKVIKHFLAVIENLLSFNNYSSVVCLGTALLSAPVSDLKKTLENIKKEEFAELEKKILICKSYQSADKLPTIPPVNDIIEKIGKINQNQILHNGRINWTKLRHLAAPLMYIKTCTTVNYTFPTIEPYKNFLKQRIEFNIGKTDFENIISFTADTTHNTVTPPNLKPIITKFNNS